MSTVWERIGPQLAWFGDEFPDEALAQANLHRDEIAPFLVAELERIASDPAPARDPRYALFLCAMHLLAQWRDVRGFEPLLRVARLPEDVLDDIFGDLIAETFDRCLASMCPGDLGPLAALAADRGATLWARVAGLEAMAIRVLEGDTTHGDAIDVLRQLGEQLVERVRAIDDAEEDWEVLAWVVAAASELGPGPMLDTIRGWFRERLVHEGIVDLASVERDARTDPAILHEQALRRGGYIRDTAQEIRQWEAYGSPGEIAFDTTDSALEPTFGMPHRRDTPKVGRNDPCPCGSGKKYKKCCGAG